MQYIMVLDIDSILQKISELDNTINALNQKISEVTEILKEQYLRASLTMKENQNYLLSGIQKSPNTKNYIVTTKGVEVVGEEEITPISAFLDNVIQFANEPNRRIGVIKELVKHLQKMSEMITSNSFSS
jgi:hypothetical protein